MTLSINQSLKVKPIISPVQPCKNCDDFESNTTMLKFESNLYIYIYIIKLY